MVSQGQLFFSARPPHKRRIGIARSEVMKNVPMWMVLLWGGIAAAIRTSISQLSAWHAIVLALSCKRRAKPSLSICRFGWLLAIVLNFWAISGSANP
jgi:hypothetical protein